MCDHVIGLWHKDGGDYHLVKLSEKDDLMKYSVREYKEWSKNPFASKIIAQQRSKWTSEQHFLSNVTTFKYCPDCGKENG